MYIPGREYLCVHTSCGLSRSHFCSPDPSPKSTVTTTGGISPSFAQSFVMVGVAEVGVQVGGGPSDIVESAHSKKDPHLYSPMDTCIHICYKIFEIIKHFP